MRSATTLLVLALWPVAATAGVFLLIHGDRGWCAHRDRENAAIDPGAPERLATLLRPASGHTRRPTVRRPRQVIEVLYELFCTES